MPVPSALGLLGQLRVGRDDFCISWSSTYWCPQSSEGDQSFSTRCVTGGVVLRICEGVYGSGRMENVEGMLRRMKLSEPEWKGIHVKGINRTASHRQGTVRSISRLTPKDWAKPRGKSGAPFGVLTARDWDPIISCSRSIRHQGREEL